MAKVEGDLRAVIEAASRPLAGISVQVKRILAAGPLTPLRGVEKLTDPLVANAAMVFRQPIACHGVPLYTDARHYAARGIPTVLYGAGPRDLLQANAQRADERLVLDDLYRATEVVARTLVELLGGAS